MAGIAINDQTIDLTPDPASLVPLAVPDGGGGWLGRSSAISDILATNAFWLGSVENLLVADSGATIGPGAYATIAAALAAASSGDAVLYLGDHSPAADLTVPAGVSLVGIWGGFIGQRGFAIELETGAKLVSVNTERLIRAATSATGCEVLYSRVGTVQLIRANSEIKLHFTDVRPTGATGAAGISVTQSTAVLEAHHCQIMSDGTVAGITMGNGSFWNANNYLRKCIIGGDGATSVNILGGSLVMKAEQCDFIYSIPSSLTFPAGNFSNMVAGVQSPYSPFWWGDLANVHVVDPTGAAPNSYLTLTAAIAANPGPGQQTFIVKGLLLSGSETLPLVPPNNATIVFPRPEDQINNSTDFVNPLFQIATGTTVTFMGNGYIYSLLTPAIEVQAGNLRLYGDGRLIIENGVSPAISVTGTGAGFEAFGIFFSLGEVQFPVGYVINLGTTQIRNCYFNASRISTPSGTITDFPVYFSRFQPNPPGNITVADGNYSNVVNGQTWGNGPFPLSVESDASRGAAGTAGRVIFNSTDGNLNIDDGANWILPSGAIT